MQPKGDCIWMIGDNPKNDILGARETINAVTLQKIPENITLASEIIKPDAAFSKFSELRKLLVKLGNK